MERGSGLKLTLLSASHGVNHLNQLLVPVLIPRITAEYGLSNFEAGVLLGCFAFSYGLMQVVSGYLSKSVKRIHLLVFGFAITSISFLILGFVDNIVVFALLLFVAGIGGSTYHPVGIPILAEIYSEKRGQALGVHQTGGALGSFVAPLAAGAMVVSLNWRLTMTVFAVPGAVLSAVLWLLLAVPEHGMEEVQSESFRRVNSFRAEMYGPALVLIAASVVYSIGFRGIDAFGNQYFVYGRHIEDFMFASFLFSTLKIAGLFSGLVCGKLSDTVGRKLVIYILVLVESISLFALTVVPLNVIIVPCILLGFASFGLLAISDAFLADITPKASMGTVFGINFSASFIVTAALSPLLGGAADLYGFSLVFAVLSIIGPLGTLILFRVNLTNR